MKQIIAGRLLTRSWKPDLQASLGHLVQLLQPLCAGEREINKKVTSLWHSSSPWFPFCHYLLTLMRFHFFHGTPKFFSYRDSPKLTKLDHTPNQKIVSLLIRYTTPNHLFFQTLWRHKIQFCEKCTEIWIHSLFIFTLQHSQIKNKYLCWVGIGQFSLCSFKKTGFLWKIESQV